MAVYVQRGRDGRMTQARLNGLRVDACGNQQTRVRVAQVVEPDPRQFGQLNDPAGTPRQFAEVQRCCILRS